MRLFHRSADPRALAVTMIGLKLGDRLLQIGAGDGGLVAALGAKVGLTGRACVVDDSPEGLARAQQAADREGVLLEVQRAEYTTLPIDSASFDIVIINRVLIDLTPETRVQIVREAVRALRGGGRCIIVDRAARGGLGALLGGPRADPTYQPEELLRSGGFKAVRTLAEREGLRFTEGVKAA